MGSYGGIRFDDLSICDSKSYIPDHWAVLFSETDRRTEMELHKNAEPDGEPHPVIWYETDRETFLSRLSLLGATEAAMKHAFDAWLAEQQENWDHYADEWKDQAGERARELQTALQSLNFESWKSHANQTLRTRYNFKVPYKPSNALEEKFHDYDESYLHIAGFGELVTIRALLQACPEVKSIKLDVSDLINSGYYDETIEICTKARRDLPFSQLLGPTIILGEGSTDLLVLKRGLEAMYPALIDYFSFFNHAEFSVDGGAIYLVKFLKAFAAAKVIGRFVAIFDNDAAGVQALEQAIGLHLPAHFCLLNCPTLTSLAVTLLSGHRDQQTLM